MTYLPTIDPPDDTESGAAKAAAIFQLAREAIARLSIPESRSDAEEGLYISEGRCGELIVEYYVPEIGEERSHPWPVPRELALWNFCNDLRRKGATVRLTMSPRGFALNAILE